MMPVLATTASVRKRPFIEAPSRSAIHFDEVLLVAQRLARWRIGATVAYRPLCDESPHRVMQRLLESLVPLAGLPTDAQLLVHVAALGYDRTLLREVLQAARSVGVPVTLDMTVPERSEALLACAAELRSGPEGQGLGLTLSCDRQSSLTDAETACALGLRLRLVQERRTDTGAGRRTSAEAFTRMVGRVAGRTEHVTLVCHDPQIVADSLECLRAADTPMALELLPEQPHQGVLWVARTHHIPIRSCVSHGRPQAPSPFGTSAHAPRVLWWSTLSNSMGTLLPMAGNA